MSSNLSSLLKFKGGDSFIIIEQVVDAGDEENIIGLSSQALNSNIMNCLVDKYIKYRLNSSTFDPMDDISLWEVLVKVLKKVKMENTNIQSKQSIILLKLLTRVAANGNNSALLSLVKESISLLFIKKNENSTDSSSSICQINLENFKQLIVALNDNVHVGIVFNYLLIDFLEIGRNMLILNVSTSLRNSFEFSVESILMPLISIRSKASQQFASSIDSLLFDVLFNDAHLGGYRDILFESKKMISNTTIENETSSVPSAQKKMKTDSNSEKTVFSYQHQLFVTLKNGLVDVSTQKEVACFLPFLLDSFILHVLAWHTRETQKEKNVEDSLDMKKRKHPNNKNNSTSSLEFAMFWELLHMTSSIFEHKSNRILNDSLICLLDCQANLIHEAGKYNFCSPNVDSTYALVKSCLSTYTKEKITILTEVPLDDNNDAIIAYCHILENLLHINHVFIEDNLVETLAWAFRSIATKSTTKSLPVCVKFVNNVTKTFGKLRQIETLLQGIFKVVLIDEKSTICVFNNTSILTQFSNDVKEIPVGSVESLMQVILQEISTIQTAVTSSSKSVECLSTAVSICSFAFLHLPLDAFTAPKLTNISEEYIQKLIVPFLLPICESSISKVKSMDDKKNKNKSNAHNTSSIPSILALLFSLIDLKSRILVWMPQREINSKVIIEVIPPVLSIHGRDISLSIIQSSIYKILSKDSLTSEIKESLMKLCLQRLHFLHSMQIFNCLSSKSLESFLVEQQFCSQFIWDNIKDVSIFSDSLAHVVTESLPYLEDSFTTTAQCLLFAKWLTSFNSVLLSDSATDVFCARRAAFSYAPFYEIVCLREPIGLAILESIKNNMVASFGHFDISTKKIKGNTSLPSSSRNILSSLGTDHFVLPDFNTLAQKGFQFVVIDSISLESSIFPLQLLSSLPAGYLLDKSIDSLLDVFIISTYVIQTCDISNSTASIEFDNFSKTLGSTLLKILKGHAKYFIKQTSPSFVIQLMQHSIVDFRKVAISIVRECLVDESNHEFLFKMIENVIALNSVNFELVGVLMSAIIEYFSSLEEACGFHVYKDEEEEDSEPLQFTIPSEITSCVVKLYNLCVSSFQIESTTLVSHEELSPVNVLVCFSNFIEYYRLITSEHFSKGDDDGADVNLDITSELENMLGLGQLLLADNYHEKGLDGLNGSSICLLSLSKSFRRFKSSFSLESYGKVLALTIHGINICQIGKVDATYANLLESWLWFSRNANSPQMIVLLKLLQNEIGKYLLNPCDSKLVERTVTCLSALKVTTSSISSSSSGKRFLAYSKVSSSILFLLSDVISTSLNNYPKAMNSDVIFSISCEVIALLLQRKKLLDLNSKDISFVLLSLTGIQLLNVPKVTLTAISLLKNNNKSNKIHHHLRKEAYENVIPFGMFESCASLLTALLRHRGRPTSFCIPSFNNILRELLISVLYDTNVKESRGITNGEVISRIYESMLDQKSAFRHHVPYLLSEYLFHEVHSPASREIKKSLRNGVNFLFDLSSKHELQQLHATLPPVDKSLLKLLHRSYEENHKFRGQV